MKEITLKSLTLRNFKGVRELTIAPEGGDMAVYGDNGTGKTTIADAMAWLLFGKDSAGRTDFEVKTLGPDGEPIHGLEHEVHAVLSVTGEPDIILRKTYAEKYTKRRGQAEAEFTGHTTDHYIDSVPVKKSEYQARINDLIPEDVFRIITNPAHFLSLHWERRRAALLDVCGDITMSEVIAETPDLAELPGILAGRNPDDHRKIVTARKRDVNRELDRIPVRIDEAARMVPDIEGTDRTGIEATIAGLEAKRGALESEIATIRGGGEVATLTASLREIEALMQSRGMTLRADAGAGQDEARERLMTAKQAHSEAELTAEGNAREVASLTATLTQMDADLERLREQGRAVLARTFEYTPGETTCPACGQDLPADRLESARTEAEADFNRRKSEELDGINRRGVALKKQADEARAKLTALQARTDELTAAVTAAEVAEVEAQQAFDAVRAGASEVDPMADDEYAELARRKRETLDRIEAAKAGAGQTETRLRGQVRELQQEIDAHRQQVAKIDAAESAKWRVTELRAEEKALAAEYERLERETYLLELYVQRRVEMLEAGINSRFTMVRWKLFERQINGGIREVCIPMVDGVPYDNNLNTGSRLNAGLDIINTMCGHHGVTAPIFVDNRESVTKLIPTQSQVISLIVSAADKALRVEGAG